MNIEKLNSFLNFGFFLDYEKTKFEIKLDAIDKKKYENANEPELINLAGELFDRAISKSFNQNVKNLVPISGGLDSRAILASLLKHTSACNISTFTFGSPNSLDFEIGKSVAKRFGTKHYSFPTKDNKYSQKDFEEISNLNNNQTFLFHHGPIIELNDIFNGYDYWSGHLGDPVTGGHLAPKAGCLSEAKDYFIKKNTFVKSTNLMSEENKSFHNILTMNFMDESQLSLEEQLDYKFRQSMLIEPHILMNGFNYKLPFMQKDFMDFFHSINNCYRINQGLYKKMLVKNYPDAFLLPTTKSFGRPLNDSKYKILLWRSQLKARRILSRKLSFIQNPQVNYTDFNNMIRTKDDFGILIFNNIMDLKDRGIVPWIDIESLWFEHKKCDKNFADALMILASLELHLKNNPNLLA